MIRKRKKRSKYKNKKTEIDGILFDSILEARYYEQLKEDEKNGLIAGFELQPSFLLIPPFSRFGKKFRKTEYIADFKIFLNDGTEEILDVKGVLTDSFRIKRKLLESLYEVRFFLVDKKGGVWRKYR